MKIVKPAWFFSLWISIFSILCYGQTPKSRTNKAPVQNLSFTSRKAKLTKTQGTNPYQNVHCMIQDKYGNIWIGTTGEGVYRYDGKVFTQFTEKDGLSNNTVWSILEDKSGNIWFGTDHELSQYNGKTISKIPLTKLISMGLGTGMQSTGKNAVYSLMQDHYGTLWFGTDNGVICLKGKTFSYFLSNPNLINTGGITLKSVQCMFEDKNEHIWFGSGPMALEGISYYDGKSLINFKPQNEGWIRKITEDRKGTLIIATRHIGMITYDGKRFNNFSEPFGVRKDLINTVLADSKGYVWYGSDFINDNNPALGGFWRYDGKSFREYTKKEGLYNSSIFSLMEDKTGNIWVGCRNCELYRFNGKAFENLSE